MRIVSILQSVADNEALSTCMEEGCLISVICLTTEFTTRYKSYCQLEPILNFIFFLATNAIDDLKIYRFSNSESEL